MCVCRVHTSSALLGAGEVFGGSLVRMADCGNFHTLVVTVAGSVWAWGQGWCGKLSLNDEKNRLTPMLVGPEHFASGVGNNKTKQHVSKPSQCLCRTATFPRSLHAKPTHDITRSRFVSMCLNKQTNRSTRGVHVCGSLVPPELTRTPVQVTKLSRTKLKTKLGR